MENEARVFIASGPCEGARVASYTRGPIAPSAIHANTVAIFALASCGVGLCGIGAPPSDSKWLTVIGDPTQPAVDTVEVDAGSAVSFGKARLVGIRVNRANDRMALDQLPFRSYESLVVIDCDKRTARHNTQTLFPLPLWKGTPRAHTYDEKDIRDMAFRGVEPNPKERIIKAACFIELVQSK